MLNCKTKVLSITALKHTQPASNNRKAAPSTKQPSSTAVGIPEAQQQRAWGILVQLASWEFQEVPKHSISTANECTRKSHQVPASDSSLRQLVLATRMRDSKKNAVLLSQRSLPQHSPKSAEIQHINVTNSRFLKHACIKRTPPMFVLTTGRKGGSVSC